MFKELYTSLMEGASWHIADQYFVLADFEDYRNTQAESNKEFKDRYTWAKKAWLNISNGGKFSSDRTIAEYARDIWNIVPEKI